jgi:uncharacterized protein
MVVLIVAIVLLALALIYLLVSYYIAGTIILLNRQPVPKTPGDYGLDFESIDFKSMDGIALKGWLIKGTQNKLIVMTHVGGLTRYGSTVSYRNLTKLYNKEIQFIRTAQHLQKAGYWVLMFDFRNHGQSGADPHHGYSAVGLKEYQDVAGALNYIQGRDDLNMMPIGFVSFCMGCNSTIIAMSKTPQFFKNVKCLMAIQPISMEVFVSKYAAILLTPPLFKMLRPVVTLLVKTRGGIALSAMSPGTYVKDIKVPTLYVQARHDPWTELRDIEGFYRDTADNPKEFFWIEDTRHRFETYSYFEERPQKMLEWVKRWV